MLRLKIYDYFDEFTIFKWYIQKECFYIKLLLFKRYIKFNKFNDKINL